MLNSSLLLMHSDTMNNNNSLLTNYSIRSINSRFLVESINWEKNRNITVLVIFFNSWILIYVSYIYFSHDSHFCKLCFVDFTLCNTSPIYNKKIFTDKLKKGVLHIDLS